MCNVSWNTTLSFLIIDMWDAYTPVKHIILERGIYLGEHV